MVAAGIYQIYGVLVTYDERKKLMEMGWADEDPDVFPDKKMCQGKKEKRCELVQVPHGFEDLDEHEDMWVFGVGKHVYFGRSSDSENNDDRGFTKDYEHLSCEALFELIGNEITFTAAEKPEAWCIPDDCPCCS